MVTKRDLERVVEICQELRELDVPEGAIRPILEWVRIERAKMVGRERGLHGPG